MEDNESKLEKVTKQKTKDTGKKILVIVILASALAFLLLSVGSWFLDADDADKLTAYGKYSINSILNISDISELVTINGTPQSGYSLAFVDDIDKKLEKVIKASDNYIERKITDPDILKQYIKAELVTQLPNLGEGLPNSKLPNLNGVDILYEPEETTNLLNSMEGVIMLGDSFLVRLHNSGLLEDGCNYYAKNEYTPKKWLDEIDTLPNNATGVCILLGFYNPDQIDEMGQLISKLIEKYPGKPIYVQKVFPLGENYTIHNREKYQEKIDKFNNEIEAYCKTQENAFWIDTTSGYVDEFGYLITNDQKGIHIDEDNQNTFVASIKSKILREYGASSSSDSDELQGSNPKEAIWTYLISKGFSEEATAGIMGNWYEESAFRSNAVQGDYRQSNVEAYDEEKTKELQAMGADGFAHDKTGGGGYGLAQWTYWSRKRNLYNFAIDQGKGIDDLKMQLDFFMWECENGYTSILEDSFKNLTNISEATVQFHSIYEQSGDDASRYTRKG